MRFLRVAYSALPVLAILAGCDDASSDELPPPTSQTPGAVGAGDGGAVAVCEGVPDGTECGAPNADMHCLFQACVQNACGDGVASGVEECDDGDEIAGDGCSDRCVLEQCGNRSVDLGEQCDDGNTDNGDGCTARCKLERCGNRVVDQGEECDDGNSNDRDLCSNACKLNGGASPDAGLSSDGGVSQPVDSGSMDSGGSMDTGVEGGTDAAPDSGTDASDASDAGSADTSLPEAGDPNTDPRSEACLACLNDPNSNAKNYQASGLDLLATCLENADPDFKQRCTAAYFCSLNATDNCKADVTRGGVSCYCGPAQTLDNCFADPAPGTGPRGTCIEAWEAASGCSSAAKRNVCVSDQLALPAHPSSYANALLNVTAVDCGSVCGI